jgi:hypothetical protein
LPHSTKDASGKFVHPPAEFPDFEDHGFFGALPN